MFGYERFGRFGWWFGILDGENSQDGGRMILGPGLVASGFMAGLSSWEANIRGFDRTRLTGLLGAFSG